MDVTKVIKEHDLGLEDPISVQYVNKKSLFVFYDETFNLNIYDFANNSSSEEIVNFKFTRTTQFEEVFTPAEHIVDDENCHYWVSSIDNKRFVFVGGSFSESADVIYKDEEDNW